MGAVLGFLDDGESLDFSDIQPARKLAENGFASSVLHGVASEIATLAGPIATVSSLFNAAELSSSSDLPHVLALLPPEPVVYPAVISGLASTHPDLIGQIQHFHVRLAFARKTTIAGLMASSGPSTTTFGIQPDVLADIWRELCQAAIDILDSASDRSVAFEPQSTRLPRLRDVLSRAATGQTPCIMADGSLEIPGIAERRLQPRYAVSWQAWLQADGDWQPITLFDIARGGIGAEGNLQLVPGQSVSLAVGDQQLKGKIAWACDQRFAVPRWRQIQFALAMKEDFDLVAKSLKSRHVGGEADAL